MLDGVSAGAWAIRAPTTIRLPLTGDYQKVRTITLHLPDSEARADVAPPSSDTRVLGIAVESITASGDAVSVGSLEPIDRSADCEGSFAGLFGRGWSDPSEGCRWTVARKAVLRWPNTSEGRAHSVRIGFDRVYFGRTGKGQRVVASLGARVLGEWTVTKAGSIEFVVPADRVSFGRWTEIALHFQDARSPLSEKDGTDPRELALFVKKVTISSVPRD